VIFLKFIGLVTSSFTELASYALIFYGIGTVYVWMGKRKKNILFIGAVSFLVGIELFITSNYDFLRISHIVLPSIFFILGTAFLVLFIDDLSNRLLLIIATIFLISAIFFFSKLGTFNFSNFLASVISIIRKYWPVLIIVTVLILLLNRDKYK
jgi:hypothetical protein